MSIDEIEHIKESFVNAAIRTQRAGFDGVEIHAAHGYLLSQFYSPYTNKRTDKYGGDLVNRTRLHNEIIREVRENVGEEYIIAIRFGAYDYLEEGSKLEDIPVAVKSFVESGADIIDISGGLCRYANPNSKEPGYFKELSKIAKDSVDVPVILTGGVKKAKDAENLLNEGYCDLIGIGRALLMDAEWSKKALKSLERI
jgi:2,4-dienoyl-CoA reductase-like NADH-dependent reductase (Old Yellow Enzyme family)